VHASLQTERNTSPVTVLLTASLSNIRSQLEGILINSQFYRLAGVLHPLDTFWMKRLQVAAKQVGRARPWSVLG
jgi:hypothetical protein